MNIRHYLAIFANAVPLCLSFMSAHTSAAEPTDSAAALPLITVSASRFDESLGQALPQTTLITHTEIEKSGLTDVSQILQKLGNVPTRINLTGAQDLSIDLRGYGATSDNNVVILLDGVRLSEIEQATARVSMIPVETIDHIEIIRGGSSVLYGEGATSGVINIVSRKRLDDLATVSAGLGSFSTQESSAYVSKQNGAVSVAAYGKTLNTDNYRQNNQAQIRSGGAAVQYQPQPNTLLGMRLYTDQEATHLPGPLTLAQFQQNPQQSINPNDYGITNGNTVTLFGSTLIQNAELAVDINARNKQASSVLPSLGGSTNSSAHYFGVSPRAKIHDLLIAGNDLSFGMDLSRWDRTYSSIYPAYPAFSTIGESLVQNSLAGYFRDDWTLSSSNRLTMGARLENIQKEVAHFNGAGANPNTRDGLSAFELQYTHSWSSAMETYARTGQSYRVPNIDDLRGAAASLLPQTAIDYELGLSFQRLSPSNATLRVFRSDIHNELAYDPVQYTNVNLAPTQREGAELEGRYQAASSIALRGSLQVIRALFSQGAYAGNRVPLVPSFNAQAGIEWEVTPYQSVDLSARLVGPQYVDSDFTNTLTQIPFFWTADLRYSNKLSAHWSMFMSLNNLLDRKYYDYANSYSGYYPSPGRNGELLLKYHF